MTLELPATIWVIEAGEPPKVKCNLDGITKEDYMKLSSSFACQTGIKCTITFDVDDKN